MKIVADNQIPYIADVLARVAQVVTIDGEGITPREVRDADILLVRTRTRCDRKLLEGSSVHARYFNGLVLCWHFTSRVGLPSLRSARWAL